MATTDLVKAAGVPSQTYMYSTGVNRYTTTQSPAYSNLDSVLDRSRQETDPSQQDSDMMRMFLPSEFVAAQTHDFDEMFTHFGMDMLYMNDDG